MAQRGGFAKVFESLWDGSLAESWETWSLFVFMLAHADADGVVDMTPTAMARRSSIPIERVRAAIDVLSAPDPDSRTPDDDGRRIVLIDDHRTWGWRIVNHARYRARRDEDARRADARERMDRLRNGGDDVRHGSPSFATVRHGSPKQMQKQKQKQMQQESLLPAATDCDPTTIGVHILLPSTVDEVEIGEAEVREWASLYPSVDVAAQLRIMRGWLLANPTRRKTRRGMRAFVTSWLAREQNKPAPGGSARADGDEAYLRRLGGKG